MMEVTSEPKSLSQQIFQLALRRLSKDIERAAKEQNILSGWYCLSYDHTFDNFRQARKLIKKSVLDYIKNTREDNEAPWKIIFREGRPKCEIKKISNIPNKIITLVSSPKYFKSEKGIPSEACQLMQKCLMDKMKKLGKINLPKILLLNDRYLFSKPHIYKKCTSDNGILEFYHSIFIVELKENSYFIHSEEKSWILNIPQTGSDRPNSFIILNLVRFPGQEMALNGFFDRPNKVIKKPVFKSKFREEWTVISY